MRIREGRQRGFSLIEIIVTLVVLSIAAVGVLSVFSTGMRGSADPLLVNTAIQLAQEKMAGIVGDRRNPGRGIAWIVPGNYPAENPVTGFPDYSRNVTLFCVDAADLNTSTGAPPCAAGYVHVTVTVTHPRISSVSIETLLSDY